MIRKFNYTGRKRIPRSRVSIVIIAQDKVPPSFEASLDLGGLKLPDSAEVFVEAYRRSFFKRFAFGTVSRLVPPPDRVLSELDSKAMVMFRVKVVDTKDTGRILAVAEKIVPRREEDEPADKICILPVDFVDLGHLVWRLDLEGDWPILQLNRKIEDIREIARTDSFFLSLVYPEVVSQILHKIVVVEDHTDPTSDPEDWMSQWLKFTRSELGVMNIPPSGESEPVIQEKLKWVEDATEAFCSNNKMLDRFVQAVLIKQK